MVLLLPLAEGIVLPLDRLKLALGPWPDVCVGALICGGEGSAL